MTQQKHFLVTCPLKVLISTTVNSFTICKTKCHLILEMTYTFPFVDWWKTGTFCPLKVKYWNLKPLQCSLEEKKHLDSMKADSLSYAPRLGTLTEIRCQIQIFDTWKLSRFEKSVPFNNSQLPNSQLSNSKFYQWFVDTVMCINPLNS